MKKIIFTIMLAVSASLTASAQTFNEFFDEVVSNNVSTSFISKFMDQTAMFGKDEKAKTLTIQTVNEVINKEMKGISYENKKRVKIHP